MKQARFYKLEDQAIVDTGLVMNAKERWRISRLIEECLTDHKDCDYIKIFEDDQEVSEFINLKDNSIGDFKMTETSKTNETVKAYELTVDAMNSLIKKSNQLIDDLNNGSLLKDAKGTMTLILDNTANLPIGIKKDIKEASRARTKALYIEAIELVKDNMVKSIKVALDAIHDIKEGEKKMEETKAKKAAKEAKPELNQDELDKIANAVKEAIKTAMDAHFQAGKLLSEALELFKAAGKPAKDWLEWANLSCSVKKAQAYNLVKVWNDFGQVSEFKGCPMRVLNILVHTSSDLYKKIEEQAKALAKKGKLDTKAINNLIDSVRPEPAKVKPKKNGKSNPASGRVSNVLDQDSTGKAIKASIESNDDQDNKDQDKPELGTSTDKAKGTLVDDKDKLIAELREQNRQLLDRIEELSKAVKESKEEPVRTATYLPQFESSEPYLVLGISPVASKEEINKRYRTMAIIFNAKTCPKGAKALKAAREEMLKTAK